MKPSRIVLASIAIACSGIVFGAAKESRPAFERLPAVMFNGKPLPFAEGVRVGDVLFLSGQIGIGSDGTLPTGIEAQARQTMDRIGATLKSAGLGWKDVIRCTVMLENMADWPAFNQVYSTYFTADGFPARSAFGADGLALGALVEVQCDAYSPGPGSRSR